MRLIDADEFLKREIHRCGCVPLIGSCSSDDDILTERVNAMPTVEAEIVRHAQWIRTFKGTAIDAVRNVPMPMYNYDCPECKYHTGNQGGKFNYCPICGAKMGSE